MIWYSQYCEFACPIEPCVAGAKLYRALDNVDDDKLQHFIHLTAMALNEAYRDGVKNVRIKVIIEGGENR